MNNVSYGDRWIAESVLSTFKKMFDETCNGSQKNMVKGLELKVELYNLFEGMKLIIS